MLLAVKYALEHSTLRQENDWRRAVEQASMAARSGARVLLIGESGTGKELLAAHNHNASQLRLKTC